MIKLLHKNSSQSIQVDRIIDHLIGKVPGPVTIFFAGIHGNEPAGVFALKSVMKQLREEHTLIKGDVYAISGNLSALEEGRRYVAEDLNRIWTTERMQELVAGDPRVNNKDQQEQAELFTLLNELLIRHKGPFYFIDLHTTSSHSVPFMTLNDTLLNRKFAMQYPTPVILGIEEYLSGPVLSYINNLGYLAIGFEGGQHEEAASIEHHASFIQISLVYSGAIPKTAQYYAAFNSLLEAGMGIDGFYEIFYRQPIKEADDFRMLDGYVNFQQVEVGNKLAVINKESIVAKTKARILMPLYQPLGEDGFFLIRRIAPIVLQISAFLRKVKFDYLLTLLPGIQWSNEQKNELKINLKTARFLAKPFFHLLGYRSILTDKNSMFAQNREAASKDKEYPMFQWKS